MKQWIWVEPAVVLALHEEHLSEHGGSVGIRDDGLLASALAPPRNQAALLPRTSVATLAAAYAFGIARNHPFVDDNKRTALVVAELFLDLNGYELTASDTECVSTFLALAAGEIEESALADWMRRNSRRQT